VKCARGRKFASQSRVRVTIGISFNSLVGLVTHQPQIKICVLPPLRSETPELRLAHDPLGKVSTHLSHHCPRRGLRRGLFGG
jgi:hypothetical protein